MEDLERIKARLDNVKSVEPILAALRTIAAGSWHLARTRLAATQSFLAELGRILAALQPHLPQAALVSQKREPVHTVGMLVIASERGLCGAFNTIVLQAAEQYLVEQRALGRRIELMTVGARAETHFRRQGLAPRWSESLPLTTVTSLTFVQRLYRRLSAEHQAGRFDMLYVVYMSYQTQISVTPILHPILPTAPRIPPPETIPWPPPIIDADPRTLYNQAIDQWALAELYRCVMESAASEQSARFRTLDGASNNCQRLIEELTLQYHAARQHAITMQMLDLVAGAGLLKPAADAQRKSPR